MSSRRNVLAGMFILMVGGVCGAQSATVPQARTIRANGVDLVYVEQGTGTPVVFVHGAVGDLRYWEPQREEVGRTHRFVAYTYRYHGTASWPDAGSAYSTATHAADLAALIKALGSGPVHLVGLSLGGTVAVLVAQQQPQLVRSLTLAEPALFGLLADLPDGKPVLEDVQKAMGPMAAASKAGDSLGATRLLVEWVMNEGPNVWDRQPPQLRQILTDNAPTLPLLFAAPPVTEVTCASLAKIAVPTLVVGGQQTARYFSLVNERVVACIPGAKLAAIPQSTHVMSYQNPAAFNAVLLQFLEKAPSRNPGVGE